MRVGAGGRVGGGAGVGGGWDAAGEVSGGTIHRPLSAGSDRFGQNGDRRGGSKDGASGLGGGTW